MFTKTHTYELTEDYKKGDKLDIITDFFGEVFTIQRHLSEEEAVAKARRYKIEQLKDELRVLEEEESAAS